MLQRNDGVLAGMVGPTLRCRRAARMSPVEQRAEQREVLAFTLVENAIEAPFPVPVVDPTGVLVPH